MARVRGVLRDSLKGHAYAYGGKVLWSRRNVRNATCQGRTWSYFRISSTRTHAAASCAICARCNVHDVSLAAWHNRQQTTNLLSPHFRHKVFEEVLWLDHYYKPVWAEAQQATRDGPINLSAYTATPRSLSSVYADQFIGPGIGNRQTLEFVNYLCQHGQVRVAVEVLEVIVGMNRGIDKYPLYSVLRECVLQKDVILGCQVQALAVKMGFESDTFLCNHFIRMYAGHGNLQAAVDVFRAVALPDTYMWSSIISAHVKQGLSERAIELYQQMRATKLKPNGYVLVAALQACAATGDLQVGKQMHKDVLNSGMESNMFVCNCLVDMYAKCGSLKDARRVFDGLGVRDVVTWNAMITGYAKVKGMGQEAFILYSAMLSEGKAVPDAVTFVGLLQACANLGVSALEKGKQLHSQLKGQRLGSDVVMGGSLVNMYVKCGSMKDARIVFDGLRQKNVVTWNAMIAGYAQEQGMGHEAFSLFSAMQNEGTAVPDAVTFVCLLQACASAGVAALQKGKQLHLRLNHKRLESDVVLGGSLVDMYAKCGSLRDARRVFDGLVKRDVVTWNAMIAGYAQQEGMFQEALSLFSAMQNEGKAVPDAITYVCLLQACANVGASALEKGKQLHLQLQGQRLESDVVVVGSLVNMYAKCGSLTAARRVFDGLVKKDVVTWTSMIAGYAQQEGMGKEALNVYNLMRDEGMASPNAVTYLCLLEACAGVGALQQGKRLHSELREKGYESDVFLGTCLVNMYAKCGHLEVSRDIFDRLPMKDLATWNALLKGYAEHGEGGMAIQCFEELLKHGIQPNKVTYICLFTACSHAGMIDLGQQYFETMLERHGVEPDAWHYNCMVDLLGRSGYLDKAELMLRASGLGGDIVSWRALLSACKSYGDAELGRRCFDNLVTLEPADPTAYLLLGSIYANAAKWDEVGKVETLRKAAGAKKVPGKACIEVKKEVHQFTVGEERTDVAATLRKMTARVKEGGHVPQTQLVFRTVSEQEKEDALCGHAEKLAIAYGLLHTPAGSTLVVRKNLRMCSDCHSSTKIISRMEQREIVVRDGHKVHRFQNGSCSCQDRP